jgi:hypothetical protein
MSHAGILTDNTGGASTINTLTPDIGGVVTPVANNIDLNGGNGIQTSNGGAGILIINDTLVRTGTATTVDAATSTAITIPLSPSQSGTFQAIFSAYEATTPASAGGQIVGTAYRPGAGAAAVVGTPDKLFETTAALAAASIDVSVSGNNVILTVTGVVGLTINWTCAVFFVTAS